MAIGDVVSGISADNTTIVFQPAAGVECLITSYFADNTGNLIEMTNGVATPLFNSGSTSFDGTSFNNMKVFVTNTLFIQSSGAGAGTFTGYTGIQIK
jgi:hypothetical protein|tara:strand:+ start:393 stop:683 length:291 start_codon:yes stop_codon:yes gene_type:complete